MPRTVMCDFMLIILLSLIVASCSTTKKYQREFSKKLQQTSTFQEQFTGFALYDLSQEEWLIEKNSTLYFTPASNTKILTLYAGLNILNEKAPVLQYQIKGDSLLFWGTGHPGFLHPELPQDSTAYFFLKNWEGPVFFSSSNYKDKRYGEGWMWDDYPYAFQAEKSPFPIYGNLVQFSGTDKSRPSARPLHFKQQLTYNPGTSWVVRSENNNTFYYNGQKKEAYVRNIPFSYSDSLLIKLLSDTLQKPISLLSSSLMPDSSSKTLYGTQHMDSLYQLMMHNSDNFIAEQILLLCSQQLTNNLQAKTSIEYVNDSLQPSSSILIWEDGSGLSRYNMLSPKSLVEILNQLWQKTDRDRLLNIFPAGGVSGTIKNFYKSNDQPYLFAKTGTLRHNHCLSGYLRTKSNKWLTFSFMNNHYTTGSQPIKQEMEKLLKWIHENY